jgi:hypothetical protein
MKVYHLSHLKNRDSILKNGIIPHSYDGTHICYEPRVFVSIKKTDLAFDYVNYENVDCWEFDIHKTKLTKDNSVTNPNYFYTNEHISSDKIKLIKSY